MHGWNEHQRNLQRVIDNTDYEDPYYNDDYLKGIYRDSDEWDSFLANPYFDDFYLLQDKQLFGKIGDEDEYDYLLPESYKND